MDKYYRIAKISPFISTANVGDYIIADYCDKIFEEIFGDYLGICIPSRERLSRIGGKAILNSDYTFVCGTNLLSSDLKKYKQWDIDHNTAYQIAVSTIPRRKRYQLSRIKENLSKIHIILLGVGWWTYQDEPTGYTAKVLKSLLDPEYLHSVRDSYTEKMLKSIGFNNVINTACPTMWRLTEDFCAEIPRKKKETVITTITDYRRNPERDKTFLEILLTNYQNVYLWLQSFEDIAYLESLGYAEKVRTVAPTLKCYDEFLEGHETDYIGTRLHGGIRALNHKRRACIIGIDNRAVEISKDTDLPVIPAGDISSKLNDWINGDVPTRIKLPVNNINKWKSQFV